MSQDTRNGIAAVEYASAQDYHPKRLNDKNQKDRLAYQVKGYRKKIFSLAIKGNLNSHIEGNRTQQESFKRLSVFIKMNISIGKAKDPVWQCHII